MDQSENVVRGSATRTKTILAIFQHWFHHFWTFPFKALGIHLSCKVKKWYFSINCKLFTIAFLLHRNNHTCLPFCWCFSKFSRHVARSRQLTYFLTQLSIQCPSTFPVKLCLHLLHFRISILICLLPLLSMWWLLSQNQSICMCHWVLLLLGLTNL